jgi:hypothetical protein
MVKIENVIERMEIFLSINTTHMAQCSETYEPLSNLSIGNIKTGFGPWTLDPQLKWPLDVG